MGAVKNSKKGVVLSILTLGVREAVGDGGVGQAQVLYALPTRYNGTNERTLTSRMDAISVVEYFLLL